MLSGHECEPGDDAGVRLAPPGESGRGGAGSRLLEREDELRRIAAAIGCAAAGAGMVVVLEGSPGIGKTRLLAAAMELAEARGVAVVSARGGQMETEFAFGVARQLFEPVLVGADRSERAELLGGAAVPAAWLVGDRGAEPSGGGDRGFATLHGLYRLTANLAARAPCSWWSMTSTGPMRRRCGSWSCPPVAWSVCRSS